MSRKYSVESIQYKRKSTQYSVLSTKYYKNGFTLVEILIAVTIIAIMMGFIVSSAIYLQKNSRDAKRKSDLGSLATALQQYYADQNYFPTTLGLSSLPAQSFTNPAATVTYLNKTPRDPLLGTSTPYVYVSLPVDPLPCDNVTIMCNNFCLYAKMEFAKASTVTICDTSPPKPSSGGYDYQQAQP